MYSDSALSVSPQGIHNTEKVNETLIYQSTQESYSVCAVCTPLCNSEVISIIECKEAAWF